MKEIRLNVNCEDKDKMLNELIGALSLPFLSIEVSINPLGYNANTKGISNGVEFLEEEKGIKNDTIRELADKHFVPAINSFIDELRKYEKEKD